MHSRLKASQLIVITDLDGTLLDQRTYSYEISLPAMRRLQAGRIPIVLCSTKTITRGDRFYHLTGGHSKREAVVKLLQLHRRQYGDTVAIGLGNSANDWPMLSAVERPVLVKHPGGGWDATVVEHLPDIERTEGVGPQGWREAIDRILDEAARCPRLAAGWADP